MCREERGGNKGRMAICGILDKQQVVELRFNLKDGTQCVYEKRKKRKI